MQSRVAKIKRRHIPTIAPIPVPLFSLISISPDAIIFKKNPEAPKHAAININVRMIRPKSVFFNFFNYEHFLILLFFSIFTL